MGRKSPILVTPLAVDTQGSARWYGAEHEAASIS